MVARVPYQLGDTWSTWWARNRGNYNHKWSHAYPPLALSELGKCREGSSGPHLILLVLWEFTLEDRKIRPKPHESQRKFHNFLQHGTFVFEKSSFSCFSP